MFAQDISAERQQLRPTPEGNGIPYIGEIRDPTRSEVVQFTNTVASIIKRMATRKGEVNE